MAEVTWTEEGQTAPPKKKIPTWVWFCGGGCLAMVVLAIVAGGLIFNAAKKAMDPERQWPALAKLLPFDERPANLELQMGAQIGMGMGMEQYMLHDAARRMQLQVQYHQGPKGGPAREQIFGSDKPSFPQNFGVMKFTDLEPGVVDVQGRPLRVLRMGMQVAGGEQALVSMMMVDATREGDDGFLFLQLTREGSADPISDEELNEILKPFHVGPNR